MGNVGPQRSQIPFATNSYKLYTAIQGYPHRRVPSPYVLNDMPLCPPIFSQDSLLLYAAKVTCRTFPPFLCVKSTDDPTA